MRVVVLAEADSLKLLCGVSYVERLLRTLERCGVNDLILLTGDTERLATLPARSRARPSLRVELSAKEPGPVKIEDIAAAVTANRPAEARPESSDLVLVIPAAGFFDPRLLRTLLARTSPAALVDSSPPETLSPLLAAAPHHRDVRLCGPVVLHETLLSAQTGRFADFLSRALQSTSLDVVDVAQQPAYWSSLRRELRPIWFPTAPAGQEARGERLLVDATQKGAQDLPALIHAPIEKWLVSYLCRTPVTPNQITLAVNIVAWIATYLFATGHLWAGAGLALAVGVLDGLDGKQARVKVETSPVGRLEHLLDSVFEYSWWLALGFHFQNVGLLPNGVALAFVLIVADLTDIAAAGSVLWRKGRSIDEWSRADRLFRLIGGRRNIYIFMFAAGLLLGAPHTAFLLMVGWAVLTAAVHLARAMWILGRSSVRDGDDRALSA